MKELREIADAYLDNEIQFVELNAATIAFKRYLQELRPLDLSDEVYRSDIHLVQVWPLPPSGQYAV